MLYGCLNGVRRVLHGCYLDVMVFFKVVLMVSVTRVLQGCFKGVSWAFHGS